MANKSYEIELDTVFKNNKIDDIDCPTSPATPETCDESPTIPLENSTPISLNLQDVTIAEKEGFSLRTKRIGRVGVFFIVVGVLIMGRYSVPDNEVSCVVDKALEVLKFANDFINQPGNEKWRSAFQAICSLLVDFVFLSTFAYWIKQGGSRLPLTLGIFYVTRALIQKVWYSPFPEGFYWEDPGMPSLVVPYGRGSDFFFSGHSGFLVICAKEMHMAGKTRFRNFNLVVLVYTILILLTYRIHYSIDIFAGVFFADWAFFRVDSIKHKVDALWLKITWGIRQKARQMVKQIAPKNKILKENVKEAAKAVHDEEAFPKQEVQP